MTATRQRSRLIIASTWLLSFLLATPPLLFALIASNHDGISPQPTANPSSSSCATPEDPPAFPIAVVIPSEAGPFRFFYAIVLASLGFAIPLLALCWVYVHMYLAARRNSQRTRRHSLSAPAHQDGGVAASSSAPLPEGWTGRRKPPPRRRCSNASLPALLFREEGRAVKTAALVIASFLFSWAPFFCTLVLDSKQSGKRLPDAVRFCALLAALSSGPVTPFLYVFRNEVARTEALKLLFWWRTREDPGTPRWGDSIHSPLTRPRAPPLGCYSHRRGKVPSWCPPRGAVSLDSGGEMDRPAPQLSPRSRSWSERQDSVSVHSFTKCGQCGNGDQVPMLDLAENPGDESLSALEAGPDRPGTSQAPNDDTAGGTETSKSCGGSPSNASGESKSRREIGSTFRLAFLPRAASRRCQTCIRQNSDSSSGSGHPLLRDGTAIVDVTSSPRRPHSPTGNGEEAKDLDALAEVPLASTAGRLTNQQNDIILELEEQFSRRSAMTTQSRADRFSTSSNLTQETSLASSGMGSTVDGSMDMDEGRRSVSIESPWSVRRQDSSIQNKVEDGTSTSQRQCYNDASQGTVDSGVEADIYAPRRARRKLQRLAAVDDLGEATLPEEDGEVFEDLPEDNEERSEEVGEVEVEGEKCNGEREEVGAVAVSATPRQTPVGPGPTLILKSFAVTPPPAKTRVTTGIKARFFRPAFRVPRYDF